MYQKVCKRLVADGNAINVKLGFIPDHIIATEGLEDANPNVYEWWRDQADAVEAGEYSGAQYGIKHNGADGVITQCADANNGFIEYDSVSPQVAIPHPSGEGEVVVSVSDWAAATNYSTGERTVTTPGTCVRPPTHNGRVFELTTDTDVGASEPSSWDVQPGETVTDGGGNVWTCREEKIVQHGGKGITIGATLSTDGDEWIVEAEKYDKVEDGGDSATYDPV